VITRWEVNELKVIDKGSGDPEIGVVACMHGDEKCGKHAIERFFESNLDLQRPVRFVIANEKAMEDGERYLDADLNRCFPGDAESNVHEEKIAAELMEELEGLNVLTMHSMKDFEEMFCLVNTLDEDLVMAPGVGKAVDVSPLGKDSIEKYLDAVSVEAGPIGTEQAAENSYQVLLNFLSYFEAIDLQGSRETPEIFEMYESVPGNYEFLAENFILVEEGEKYAENYEEELRAEEPFYPILMSTDGYEKILGFKGRKPVNQLKAER